MNFYVSMLWIRRPKRIKLLNFEHNKAKIVQQRIEFERRHELKRVNDLRREVFGKQEDAEDEEGVKNELGYDNDHRYPSVGSNFSKPPTLSEIPKIQIQAGWVSSKTQKDTKPIKNWNEISFLVL